MKKEKSKELSIIITLIIVLIIIIGVGTAYKKYSIKNNKSHEPIVKVEKNKKEEETEKKLSGDSEEVKKAIEVYKKLSIDKNDLYLRGISSKDIDANDLIATALLEYKRNNEIVSACKGDLSSTKVSINEINKNLNKLLIGHKTISIEDIKKASLKDGFTNYKYYTDAPNFQESFGYNVNQSDIDVVSSCGATGGHNYEVIKVEDALLKDGTLVVNAKIAFGLPYYTSEAKFYNNIQDRDKKIEDTTETITVDLKKEIEEQLDWTKYNNIKITFKVINDNYFFYSTEV